jgi:hypothetical protein
MRVSALGFFRIDKGLLVSVIGVIITYTLILRQSA